MMDSLEFFDSERIAAIDPIRQISEIKELRKRLKLAENAKSEAIYRVLDLEREINDKMREIDLMTTAEE